MLRWAWVRAALAVLLLCGMVGAFIAGIGPETTARTWTTASATTAPVHRFASTAPVHRFASIANYSVQLHWAGVTVAGVSGYYITLDSSRIADVASSPYPITGLVCGTSYQIGVQAHNNVGGTSSVYLLTHNTPACSTGNPACTFGISTVGGSTAPIASDVKDVVSGTAPSAGAVQSLLAYIGPTGTAGSQAIRGVFYANSSGAPNALLGTSDELQFTNTTATGWRPLIFPTSPQVASGSSYWMGKIAGVTGNIAQQFYTTSGGITRHYNNDTYTDGPTNPFGTASSDTRQMSLCAVMAPAGSPLNTAIPTVSDTGTGGTRPTNCFPSPGACGFPDPAFANDTAGAWTAGGTGVGPYCDSQLQALIGCTLNAPVACTSLPYTSNGGALSGTISDTNITGKVDVASGITLHDDCLTASGTNLAEQYNPLLGLTGGTTTITDSIVRSTDTSHMLDWGIWNNSGNTATLSHDYIYNFAQTLQGKPWNVTDSYLFTTAGAFTPNGPGGIGGITPSGNCNTACPSTMQDVYYDSSNNGGGAESFNHDTMLNPHGENLHGGEGAVIYGDNAAADITPAPCGSPSLTVKNSLLGGGSSDITTCGGLAVNGTPVSNSAGSSSIDIENNDFVRCTTPTIGYSATGDTTAVSCQGAAVATTTDNSTAIAQPYPGADSHGYAPNGASHYVNVIPYCNGTITGNYWDDTGGTGAQAGTGTLALNTCGQTAASFVQGQTLSATTGTWSPTATSYTYQWQDCNATGTNCKPIVGATSSTYVVAAADVGSTVRTVVKATNAAGWTQTASMVTPTIGAPPGQPTNVAATAGVNSATVTWNAPSTGSAVTSYTITPYIGSTAQTETTITGAPPATSAVISDLTAGTSYTFKVTASNSFGTGPASAASNSITPSSGGLGSVPCALNAAAVSCWASHTGVTNGTGCTEATVVAGNCPGMTTYVGNVTISSASSAPCTNSGGECVIDHYWIRGCVAVSTTAPVLIENSLIRSPNFCLGGDQSDGVGGANTGNGGAPLTTGLTIQNTTLDSQNSSSDWKGVAAVNFTCDHCEILGATQGIHVSSNGTFKESYVHDADTGSGGAHEEVINTDSGNGATITHNYLNFTGGTQYVTGGVMIGNTWGPPHNQTISDNYVYGGRGAPFDAPCNGVNISITNNAIETSSTGSYLGGPGTYPGGFNGGGGTGSGNIWSGNYDAENTGQSVGLPGNACQG